MPEPTLSLVHQCRWPVRDYDLGSTLASGQTFRWIEQADGWEGVVGRRWVKLRQQADSIEARSCDSPGDWSWLAEYLQTETDLGKVLATFPDEEALRNSVNTCRGLRLLRQEPWECLASFILSSTKQIVQIQQIIAAVCQRWGDPLTVPADHPPVCSFPGPERLAAADEAQLRACKMEFRAPNLLSTARRVADGKVNLTGLKRMELAEAREVLMGLPGVGRKIADCVLLFAYGFQAAFPVDVWVMRAMRQLYFPRRKPSASQLRHFIDTHFGPHAGYVQQYLFHYMRLHQPASQRKSRSS